MTTAWRAVGDKRLRRPAGGLEEVTGLGDDLVTGASLDGLDLAGSRRTPLSLVDSVLRRCDLSAAVWQAVTLRQVEVVDCRARGVRLSVDLAQDVYLSGCRFDQATLRIERVRGLVVFDGCVFTEAVVGGDLSSVVFADCGFDEAEFAATRAGGCDLRSSRLAGARGLLTLRGARITGDQSVAIAARLAAESGFVVED